MSINSGTPSARPLWDVFICHASEDKIEFVRPLALALQKAGVKVWYDEFEIKLGDSIVSKIEKGLANSRAGILVISEASIEMGWPVFEANTIKQLHIASGVRLIPILRNITFERVRAISPTLLDFKSIETTRTTIEECAYQIISAVRPDIKSQIFNEYIGRRLDKANPTVEKVPINLVMRGNKLRDKLPERDLLRLAVLASIFADFFKDGLESWIDSF
jgi:hypothetical protein